MSIQIDCRVADCMTRNVVSVHRDEDLTHAIGIMDLQTISVLPVVDDSGHICGVLSTSDLIGMTYNLQCDISVLPHVSKCVRETLVKSLEAENEAVKVSSVMSRDIESIRQCASVAEAAEKLIACKVHHLPVIDDKHFLAGIISTTDIVRAVADANQAATDVPHMDCWEDDCGQYLGDDYAWKPHAHNSDSPNGDSQRSSER